METRRFDLLTLALLPGITSRGMAAAARAGSLSEMLARPSEHPEVFPAAACAALHSGRARERAEQEGRKASALGISLVCHGEAEYPSLLGCIFDPPPVLWVQGRLPADAGCSVAVVGSRRASPAGRALARALARDLARAGCTVVSGLALGIDGEAHRGALEASGPTVAVLGSGLDHVYPAAHAELARAIALRGGALVSEFPLGQPPYKGSFPRRNRIIAGWSPGVVVVEAAARSGALVTARLALEEGREVLAVPGHPCSELAAGTNALIRDGAVLVRDAADVAEALGWMLPPRPAAPSAAEPVLSALRPDAPCTLDELQARSGLAVPELLSRLSALELERKVQRLPGALYLRSG